MTQSEFREVLNDTFEQSSKVLDSKRAEYTPDADRLANFKTAAALENVQPITALGGMLAKHTVSVHDYIAREEKGEEFTLKQWDEKIIDVVNYMILLRACIIERESEKKDAAVMSVTDPQIRSVGEIHE